MSYREKFVMMVAAMLFPPMSPPMRFDALKEALSTPLPAEGERAVEDIAYEFAAWKSMMGGKPGWIR